jgi:sporulation protein YlmC with PRC-barrel domain
VDLVRDLLDQPVVDRHGREMGRVDGIVLEERQGEPPRLSGIVIGPSALGFRLHPTIGRWVTAVEYAFGLAEGRPVRIDVDDISEIDQHVKTDLAISETSADAVEGRLRAWIAKIPGSR